MDAVIDISEMSRRTGVSAPVLRSWERRYGFPQPVRDPNGRRGYRVDEIEQVQEVLRGRSTGLSLTAAVRRARQRELGAAPSVFAAVRRTLPGALRPLILPKQPLIALSHAIEDEYLARGSGGVIAASFQSADFYRQSEARWREIARTSRAAIVFADFDRLRVPPTGPAEIPLPADHPLLREWAVACEAPGLGVCLTAWERPGSPSPGLRDFESIWTVEPEGVRAALDVFLDIASEQLPRLVSAVRTGLTLPAIPTGQESATATAVAARMVDYATRAA